MCCKKLANFQQSSWKIILSHYLRQVGGRLFLSCNFSVKKLPVTLPKFYVECLQTFSEHSASVREQILNLSNSSRSSTVIWNNRHILIDGKSVFYQGLFDKGIITLENLVTDTSLTNSRGSRVAGPMSRSRVQCRGRGSNVAVAGPKSRSRVQCRGRGK